MLISKLTYVRVLVLKFCYRTSMSNNIDIAVEYWSTSNKHYLYDPREKFRHNDLHSSVEYERIIEVICIF